MREGKSQGIGRYQVYVQLSGCAPSCMGDLSVWHIRIAGISDMELYLRSNDRGRTANVVFAFGLFAYEWIYDVKMA